MNDSFQYRVGFAANYITRGISNSRALDGCFEMWDGDLVVTALVRRAMQNPRLWHAIAAQWMGEFPSSWLETATKYAHLRTRQLPAAALEMQTERSAP